MDLMDLMDLMDGMDKVDLMVPIIPIIPMNTGKEKTLQRKNSLKNYSVFYSSNSLPPSCHSPYILLARVCSRSFSRRLLNRSGWFFLI